MSRSRVAQIARLSPGPTVGRDRIRIYRFERPSKPVVWACRTRPADATGRRAIVKYGAREWLHILGMSVPPSDRIFARRELGIVTHLEGSAAAGNSLGGHGRDAGAGEGGLLGAEGDGRLDGGHVHGDGSHCALVGAMDTDASVRVRRAVMALAGGPASLIFSAISQEKPEKWLFGSRAIAYPMTRPIRVTKRVRNGAWRARLFIRESVHREPGGIC